MRFHEVPAMSRAVGLSHDDVHEFLLISLNFIRYAAADDVVDRNSPRPLLRISIPLFIASEMPQRLMSGAREAQGR
jgi:hypothetical protein